MNMVRIIMTPQDVMLIGLIVVILFAVLCSLIIGYILSVISDGIKRMKRLKRRLCPEKRIRQYGGQDED